LPANFYAFIIDLPTGFPVTARGLIWLRCHLHILLQFHSGMPLALCLRRLGTRIGFGTVVTISSESREQEPTIAIGSEARAAVKTNQSPQKRKRSKGDSPGGTVKRLVKCCTKGWCWVTKTKTKPKKEAAVRLPPYFMR
jgi:hypothetical protein